MNHSPIFSTGWRPGAVLKWLLMHTPLSLLFPPPFSGRMTVSAFHVDVQHIPFLTLLARSLLAHQQSLYLHRLNFIFSMIFELFVINFFDNFIIKSFYYLNAFASIHFPFWKTLWHVYCSVMAKCWWSGLIDHCAKVVLRLNVEHTCSLLLITSSRPNLAGSLMPLLLSMTIWWLLTCKTPCQLGPCRRIAFGPLTPLDVTMQPRTLVLHLVFQSWSCGNPLSQVC